MMRIITGSAKGIRLNTLEGTDTRPTAERVKEAVFSMIQMDIEGRDILDLFSGSGQMALEALSRGAASAVMLDNSALAVKIITDNATKTKLINRCEIKKIDYLSYIKSNAKRKFDIIFIDPPYSSGFYEIALNALLEYDMLKSSSIIICESGDNVICKNLDEKYEINKQVKYGKTFISLLSLKPLIRGEAHE